METETEIKTRKSAFLHSRTALLPWKAQDHSVGAWRADAA